MMELLISWLTVSLDNLLINYQLINSLYDWLTVQLNDCWNHLVNDSITIDWLTDWLTELHMDCMTHRLIDWLYVWLYN